MTDTTITPQREHDTVMTFPSSWESQESTSETHGWGKGCVKVSLPIDHQIFLWYARGASSSALS
ncbi:MULTISPECIES: hypothetical protein [Burkholderia cepacia complex]|uniref:hypothetical protein n=1 Tax=Burkholderia cepacia complex TaxID=87882 RepID=UPI0011B2875C|nr:MULTISPECIES: hypothetical protein [Burkholderia cepacia complex]MBY4710712.1 hypothetical protein [Burkholderia cepacia]MBY4737106.1 hypothetical protein [Burkholderia cepacia]MBY4744444.1 hypothetical protein [Burkholderia cepacia]MBY4758441.1 hypothetical protein [Burkholderia cepacia]MBY4775520.1 hypothetical protein [Burkholderia cepacia]